MHIPDENACIMAQVTIRSVEQAWVTKAKQEAKAKGVSMNTVLVEALKRGLGVEGQPKTNGLEKFAGDSDFGPEWDNFLDELNVIHPENWK